MDEVTRAALRQELLALDQEIAELNTQIRNICWRHSSDGDRRNACDPGHTPSNGNPLSATEQVVLETPEASADERRLPPAQHFALLRRELSAALQRYLAVQALLRNEDNQSSYT